MTTLPTTLLIIGSIIFFVLGGLVGVIVMALDNNHQQEHQTHKRKKGYDVNNTLDTTKWLILDSDEYRSHVKYSEIAAFVSCEDDKHIRIYLKGNSVPIVFGFSNLDDLRFAHETISNNLSMGGDKKAESE